MSLAEVLDVLEGPEHRAARSEAATVEHFDTRGFQNEAVGLEVLLRDVGVAPSKNWRATHELVQQLPEFSEAVDVLIVDETVLDKVAADMKPRQSAGFPGGDHGEGRCRERRAAVCGGALLMEAHETTKRVAGRLEWTRRATCSHRSVGTGGGRLGVPGTDGVHRQVEAGGELATESQNGLKTRERRVDEKRDKEREAVHEWPSVARRTASMTLHHPWRSATGGESVMDVGVLICVCVVGVCVWEAAR